MKKEELIQLHKILVQIKRYFEEMGIADKDSFPKYNKLDINPSQIHRSRKEHKEAILVLAKELVFLTTLTKLQVQEIPQKH